MKKPRLIILSDLRGDYRNEWIEYYTEKLKSIFEIKFYSSITLGGVDKGELKEEIIHKQFVNGGIERAVDKLLLLEKKETHVLAFSIGGTIAWKAGLKGLLIKKLVTVSATRLRYETCKPKGDISLFYGGDDLFIPQVDWFENIQLSFKILENKEHDMYKEKEIAELIGLKLKS